jgi:hypothetical protein
MTQAATPGETTADWYSEEVAQARLALARIAGITHVGAVEEGPEGSVLAHAGLNLLGVIRHDRDWTIVERTYGGEQGRAWTTDVTDEAAESFSPLLQAVLELDYAPALKEEVLCEEPGGIFRHRFASNIGAIWLHTRKAGPNTEICIELLAQELTLSMVQNVAGGIIEDIRQVRERTF